MPLRKIYFLYIGYPPIREIKPLELMVALSKMQERGTTEKARKVRQRYGEVWKYAILQAELNITLHQISVIISWLT